MHHFSKDRMKKIRKKYTTMKKPLDEKINLEK